MYTEFAPDFIIGSNVSYNADPPSEDDLRSQLTNMLVNYQDYTLPCEDGLIIEPETEVSTFAFEDVEQAIQDGYETALKQIDSLRLRIDRSVSAEEVRKRRVAFRQTIIPLNVTSISTHNKGKPIDFPRLSMIKHKKEERLDAKQIEKRYFRLYAAPQVGFLFPKVELKEDSTYNLDLTVRKAKDFRIDVGGHVSSRPVNTGYVGLTYQTIGNVVTRTHLESYFGKFYGSAKADFTLAFPAVYPISTTAYFALNRWDYFRSFATFFEDVQPSFLVQNEIYAGLKMNLPIGNTIKSGIEGRYFQTEDEYYRTENFTNADTADVTRFSGVSGTWRFMKNSLNRKQFASSGHKVEFIARFIAGEEQSVPGSTSFQNFIVNNRHTWINLGLEYQSFVVDNEMFHFGIHGQAAFSSQKFFANYTATLLAMNEFSLNPDGLTYFLPEYRAPQFLSAGLNAVFTLRKNLDFRVDAYYYQPILQIIQTSNGSIVFDDYFTGGTYMASSSLIYHSFLGPIRATLNLFPEQEVPLAFQMSFGYVLFNERAIR